MDGQTDGQTDGRMDGCMHACMHACMGGWVDGWMGGWVDGRKAGRGRGERNDAGLQAGAGAEPRWKRGGDGDGAGRRVPSVKGSSRKVCQNLGMISPSPERGSEKGDPTMTLLKVGLKCLFIDVSRIPLFGSPVGRR